MATLDDLITRIDNLVGALERRAFLNAPAPSPPPCRYTFHRWLDEWLRVKAAVKPSTLYMLNSAIRCHIKPNVPDISLDAVTGFDLQKFLTTIGKSRTREAVHAVLFGAFRSACDLRVIPDNPMRGVKIPTHKRQRGAALDAAERRAFLSAVAGSPYERYFKILLLTGMRRSEALALCPADVDRGRGLLHVPGTKTDLSDRIVPIFPGVPETLPDDPPGGGLYFPFRPDCMTRAFKRLCPNHKLHDLRHTFATVCLERGVPLAVIRDWLGHSEIGTTADIYAHVLLDFHYHEAEKLNGLSGMEKG
jgi:integrase